MILEWFLNLLTVFVTWLPVAMKSLSIPQSVDVFKFGTILTKNLLKTSTAAWTSVIIFCEAISSWSSWETIFFDGVVLDFVFVLSVKNGFTIFHKVLLSVMALASILLKKFFFSLLIKLSQRLRCLLYAFLSMSFFVFQNLFLRRYIFMISLFSFLFIKGAWFAQTYRFFMRACLWIALSRTVLNWSNSRSLFSEVILF